MATREDILQALENLVGPVEWVMRGDTYADLEIIRPAVVRPTQQEIDDAIAKLGPYVPPAPPPTMEDRVSTLEAVHQALIAKGTITQADVDAVAPVTKVVG